MKIDIFGLPPWIKFAIAIVYDVVDLLSIPGLGELYDVVGIPLGYALWGPLGLANAWEVLDPMDAADRFIPTMTIVGVLATFGGK